MSVIRKTVETEYIVCDQCGHETPHDIWDGYSLMVTSGYYYLDGKIMNFQFCSATCQMSFCDDRVAFQQIVNPEPDSNAANYLP